MTLNQRDFRDDDAPHLNQVALAAFSQFKKAYTDWPAMADGIARMSDLSVHGEIIVAEAGGRVVGGVVYVPADALKADYFDAAWPIIRMLVVDPSGRGLGLGRRLTEACIQRARRDRAALIALHTTPIMTVALPMYQRMGFVWARDAPPIYGVPYAVYTKML